MEELKQELKQLKIQIRVGIDQKQISKDWGIFLLASLEKAINYTRCCKSDSELLSKRPNTSSTWECFTKAEKQQKGNV